MFLDSLPETAEQRSALRAFLGILYGIFLGYLGIVVSGMLIFALVIVIGLVLGIIGSLLPFCLLLIPFYFVYTYILKENVSKDESVATSSPVRPGKDPKP